MTSFIDRNKKLIFIHVPKTGGTSIHDAVAGVDAELIPALHITTTDMRNLVGEDVYDKFMTFTVMRNPYDWLVSLFEYRYHVDILSAAIPDHYSNFEMFIDRFYSINENLQSYWFVKDGVIDVDKVIDFSTLESDVQQIEPKATLKRLNAKDKYNLDNHYESDTVRQKAEKLLRKDIQIYKELFNDRGKSYRRNEEEGLAKS